MRYQLAVIGGGPAGYSAALEAARLGMSVILFEKDLLGGTCLNRGCVPTKFLVQTAHVYTQARNGSRYGVWADRVGIDFAAAIRKEQEIVAELRTGLRQLLLQKKVVLVDGSAELMDESHVSCGGAVYEAENILIASGSVPAESFMPGAVTTDELLKMDRVPESLKIIGGGVSAVEFAQIFHALGSRVVLAVRGERILRKWDRDIAVGLTQSMKKRGIEIRTKCTPGQLCERDAEVVLSAVGRVPNTEGLNGSFFDLGSSGGIVTDDCGRTRTPGIYAAGDVVEGSPQLAHVGMEQGKRAVRCMAGLPPEKMPAVVRCIYTDPEAASVGMTEAEAKVRGIAAVSARLNMRANARTLIATEERCFIKLTAKRDSRRLLGAQLLCERAGDLAGEIALAVNQGLTVEDLCRSLRPHPSFSEGITDVAEALRGKLA